MATLTAFLTESDTPSNNREIINKPALMSPPNYEY